MPTPIDELVDELKRLKPGSPALRHFEDIADRIEHCHARGVEPDGEEVRRVFARYSSNVVALLKR